MKHKPDIKLLKRVLDEDPARKLDLVQFLKLTTTNVIDQWISRGKLPKTKRRYILQFLRRAA